MKDLRSLQGIQFSVSQDANATQESFLPGIKLQDLHAVQDLIHQFDPTVHELHLNLLTKKSVVQL